MAPKKAVKAKQPVTRTTGRKRKAESELPPAKRTRQSLKNQDKAATTKAKVKTKKATVQAPINIEIPSRETEGTNRPTVEPDMDYFNEIQRQNIDLKETVLSLQTALASGQGMSQTTGKNNIMHHLKTSDVKIPKYGGAHEEKTPYDFLLEMDKYRLY